MSTFSATDAAFTGIRFVRHNLRIVAIWAGIQVAATILIQTATVAALGPALAQWQNSRAGANPQQSLAMAQQVLPFEALLILVVLAVYAVVYATMNRAVLRPADDGFAYIRLGMDEVRQFVVMLIWTVIAFIAEVILAIIAAIASIVMFGIGRGPQPLAAFFVGC